MTEEIRKLSDYEHLRLRSEMYLGSRTLHTQEVLLYNESGPYIKEISWVPALYTCFREILDNSLDEIIGFGYGNRIDIWYNEEEKTFKIADNGRGIPIEKDKIEGIPKAQLVLAHVRAGRNFGERGNVAGTNGIGASGVNFVSEWFRVEIHRDGKKFNQEFKEGNSVVNELHVGKPVTKKTNSSKTGTQIEWKLSSEVFKEMVLPEEFIKSRVYEIAFVNPLLQIYYNGERIKAKATIEKSLFPNRTVIPVEIKQENFTAKFFLVPGFVQGGDFYHSVVNNIPAFNGGSHVDQFRRQFFGGLLQALEREGKRRKLQPNRSDVTEGLLIYNVTNMKAPNFDSQSKTRLINEEAATHIRQYLNKEDIFPNIIKKNREWIDEIFQRCAERTMQKEVEEVQKKSKKLTKRKVAKLMEASSNNRGECILFLAEGDCLEENTEVYCLENGGFQPKKIKDINIGDIVLTHKNNLSTVTSTSMKVKQGLTLKTKLGDLIISKDHRLLVYNKKSNTFEWVMGRDINIKDHQLIRNRIVDHTDIKEIINLEYNNFSIDDKKYDLKINFLNNFSKIETIYSTNTHKFLIFDPESFCFKHVCGSNLTKKMCLVLKSSFKDKQV